MVPGLRDRRKNTPLVVSLPSLAHSQEGRLIRGAGPIFGTFLACLCGSNILAAAACTLQVAVPIPKPTSWHHYEELLRQVKKTLFKYAVLSNETREVRVYAGVGRRAPWEVHPDPYPIYEKKRVRVRGREVLNFKTIQRVPGLSRRLKPTARKRRTCRRLFGV